MKLLKTAPLLLLLTASAFAQQNGNEQPAALVEIDKVRSEMIAQQIWVPGTVVSRTDSDIASEVSGRITWMAEVGDLVEEGQVLAKLDDHMLQLQQQQNVANIAKWEARVTLLERKGKRFAEMARQNATSKDQLDEINSDLEIARQELNQARIDQKLTAYQISQSEVKAPFKSLVVDRLQSPGEYTSTGQDIIRIVDTTNVEASIKAPLSVVPFIDRGMTVAVTDTRQQKQETIRTIVPVGNSVSRMMEIRVALEPGDFAIGSAVRVALPSSDFHQGVTVPRDALVLRKSGAFVYQVDKEDVAKQVAVTTGIGVGDRIEVFGAIETESPVVVRGAERLREGQKVRYDDGATEIAKLN